MQVQFIPRHIGFLMVEGFTMIAFANAIEAFRMANYVSKQDLYRFSVAGLVNGHTNASNHISVNHTASMADLLSCDMVFVCGGFDLSNMDSAALRSWLQRLGQQNMPWPMQV